MRDDFERLMTVLQAALLNPPYGRDIEIKTRGYEPFASVTLQADQLAEFIKEAHDVSND